METEPTRLKKVLNKYAEEAIPATLDLEFNIMREVKTMHRSAVGTRGKLFKLAALICVTAFTMTAVYVFAQGLIHPDAGINAAQAENLVKQINQTRTITSSGDITQMRITLDYAYADINRIAVGYHISGAIKNGTKPVIMTNPTLIDDHGRTYFWLPSTGQQGTSATPADSTTTPDVPTSFIHEGLMSFEASIFDKAPEHLNLNLQIEVAYAIPDDPNGMILAGVGRFDFDLPFNPGRTLALEQTAKASPFPIKLQRLILSPSASRLEVCFDPKPLADNEWLDWQALVTLDVGGVKVLEAQPAGSSGLLGQPLTKETECRALVLPNALMKQPGKWTLTIDKFHNTTSNREVNGPWQFIFDVSRLP